MANGEDEAPSLRYVVQELHNLEDRLEAQMDARLDRAEKNLGDRIEHLRSALGTRFQDQGDELERVRTRVEHVEELAVGNRHRIWWILGGVAVLAFVITIVATFASTVQAWTWIP